MSGEGFELHPSLLRQDGALRFSMSRLQPLGGPQDVGHVAVAAGRGVLRLGSLKTIQLYGKERHAAGLIYACRVLRAPFAFQCLDSRRQSLGL